MTTTTPSPAAIEAVEARNARIGDDFQGLPDSLPSWRIREIGNKSARMLGLSSGAREHLRDALDLIGNAWRGPHPMAFRSVIAAAVRAGVCERQIARYEAEIIRAGYAYRAVKHARRRGGAGGNGLNFSPFAARLDDFEALADRLDGFEQEHRTLRAAHSAAVRRIRAALDDAAQRPALARLVADTGRALAQSMIARITARVTVEVLRAAVDALRALRAMIEAALAAVDNSDNQSEMSDQSDISVRHYKSTTRPFYPSDTCSEVVDKRAHPDGCDIEALGPLRGNAEKRRCEASGGPVANISIKAAIKAASDDLRTTYARSGLSDDWAALASAASVALPSLGIHPSAWREAVAEMGAADAALCVVAIDRKHRMGPDDARYVGNPGGSLRAMTRRARSGALVLERSIMGLAADA